MRILFSKVIPGQRFGWELSCLLSHGSSLSTPYSDPQAESLTGYAPTQWPLSTGGIVGEGTFIKTVFRIILPSVGCCGVLKNTLDKF